MRVLVLVLTLTAAPALSQALDPAQQASPLEVSLDGEPLAPMPAGAEQTTTLTVQRQMADEPAPGPGEVELELATGEEAGCRLADKRLQLDPATGRARTQLHCQPREPRTWPIEVHADPAVGRSDTWTDALTVQPDELAGSLAAGTAEGYRFPLNVTLTPRNLDQAQVDLALEAHLVDGTRGFQPDPLQLTADGSTATRELLALQGSGTYTITAEATGPRVHAWNGSTQVTVPEPPDGDTLAIDLVVDRANASLSLTEDPVNEDGKHKAPGETITTRIQADGTDHVNVTVTRPANDEAIPLAETIVTADGDGVAEHTFAHAPLPAGPLQVQARAGEAQTKRTVHVPDRTATTTLSGPDRTTREDRGWQGNLTIEDPNFGSTPMDPGPIEGLPDVSWTVYKGARYGSAEAEGFAVEIGSHAGASNGTAPTSTVTWPADEPATIGPGWARVPVHVQPPSEAQLRDYRLSVYEAASGDLLATAPFELYRVQLDAGPPRAHEPWPVDVATTNVPDEAHLDLRLARNGTSIANQTLAEAGAWRPDLPELPAQSTLTVEASLNTSQAPPTSAATLTRTVPQRPAQVDVHPVLDGVATTTPVLVHPAGAHELALVHDAYDPNTGPVNVSQVQLAGPGDPDWSIQRPEEGLTKLQVPAGSTPGRYAVQLHLDDGRVHEVPVHVGEIVRLGVDGPEALQLDAGEPRTVEVNVTNLGNLALEGVQIQLATEANVSARAGNGTTWVPEGRALGFSLGPGQTRGLPVELEAHEPGQARLELTVAGVVP
ncbi:hypothetical protein BRD56_11000 [Thermoplasmatales archaeon SW_10_69_26]|nr:MAG: hypothetical protein BRD56_11000 [Thermoplasmatales archaeon SW_10_69_26]